MKIAIGSDQVGFPLKRAVIDYLESKAIVVEDVGTYDDERQVDYTDFALLVSGKVASRNFDQGILICGTGLGMSIAANKQPGVRAALCHDVYTARQARAHNNANVLCMGGWVVTPQRAELILDTWLDTEFEGGRHIPRVAVLNQVISEPVAAGFDASGFTFGVTTSATSSVFGPLLFAGDIERGLSEAGRTGFKAVELSLRNPEDISPKKLKDLLAEKDLQLSAVATGQSCLHDSLCLACGDAGTVKKTVERLKSIIHYAGQFSAPVIIGGVRGKFASEQDIDGKPWRLAVEAVRELAQYAAEENTELLFEPINRYETNFINSTADGLKFIDEVKEANIRLLLDTFHMNIEDQDIAAAINTAGKRIGYVHIADSNRKAPGQGHFDFSRFFNALAAVGYKGPITAEILPLPDDLTAIQNTSVFVNSLYKPEQAN